MYWEQLQVSPRRSSPSNCLQCSNIACGDRKGWSKLGFSPWEETAYDHGCKLSHLALGMQVFRTEIISRRLNKSATLPLMSAALTTVAGIMAVAAACTHPKVLHHTCALYPALICPVLTASLRESSFCAPHPYGSALAP